MPYFLKSIDSIWLKTELFAKIELYWKFSLLYIKFVVNQFNYPPFLQIITIFINYSFIIC